MSGDEPNNSQSMFSNVHSFMGVPVSRDVENADLIVVGIPYDLGTTGRAGTRHGPQAVRLASANLRWEMREKRHPWGYSAFERLKVVDFGDLEFPPGESEDMVKRVIDNVESIHASGKKTLCIGGDHFITLPLLRAVHKHRGALALVQFDAHTDTYEESDKYDHGGMFHLAPKERLIEPGCSIQLGIRTAYDHECHDFKVIPADQLNDMTISDIQFEVMQCVGNMPIYLTFDIDCLDPAYAPGTGTPVVGGISSDRALKIIRSLKGLNVVGADVVEVAPAYDHAEITALAAATIGLELIHLMGSA
ncbi:MAG: agmatinase [Cellvibrionales bacterium TMED148]|nr:agmatinase [Porticoccaceae bacterium]RPG89022.1 MAG: agmatinase [Cellvibrionales bacterium TMED148]